MLKKGVILLLVFFVAACAPQDGLPNPPDLDSTAPIGQAFEAVSGSANDAYNKVCRENTCTEISTALVDSIDVSKIGEEVKLSYAIDTDALYETSYLFSASDEMFFYPLDFEGSSPAHPDSNLEKGPVYYSRPSDGSKISKSFSINEKYLFEGENILLSFYCTVLDSGYDCNKGRWVASSFNVKVGQPDLFVSSDILSINALPGDIVSLSANVQNLGLADSSEYEYQWYVDGVESGDLTTFLMDFLPSPHSKDWTAGPSRLEPYVLSLVLDPNNRIEELDETNNQVDIEVNVYECTSDETRCYLESSGESLNMIQKCGSDGIWELSKLKANPCGPGLKCSSGKCIDETLVVCGNGKVESGEECDDSNTVNGDGCNSLCKKESVCTDSDDDGYCLDGISSSTLGVEFDCNDNDASIYPAAKETCGDGIDQDCDGSDEVCSECLSCNCQVSDSFTSLASYWNFDGGNYQDIIGTNDQAKPYLVETVTGHQKEGAHFNGEVDPRDIYDREDKISRIDYQATGLDFGNKPFAVSVWVKANAKIPGNRGTATILMRDGRFKLDISTGDHARMMIVNSARTGWNNVEGSSLITDDKWHHIVAGRNSDELFLYVDGVLEKSSTSGVSDSVSMDGLLMVGRDSGCSHGCVSFPGTIDELAIFNRELSSDEVMKIFNLPTDCSDESGLSEDSNAQEIIPIASYKENPKFTGINAQIKGNLGPVNDWTVEFVMNSDAVENYRNPFDANFKDRGNNAGPRFEQYGSNKIGLITSNDASQSYKRLFVEQIQSGKEFHIVATRKGNNLKLYANGELKDQGETNLLPTKFSNVVIGKGFGQYSERHFKGTIRDVNIYDEALTENQVMLGCKSSGVC